MEKLVLVDGHNMLFRVFYGMQRPIQTADGRDMKCPVGFASSISKLVADFDTSKLLVLFDSVTSTKKRLEFYPDYKQNRIDYSELSDDENPFTRLPDVYRTLDHLNVGYMEADGYEADDYIASICEKYKEDYEIIIVSTDSDFNQLIEEHISIFKPRGKKSELITLDNLVEKFGVRPEQVIEYKSLIGDTADNIPGIKGIGPKRAAEILSYGTLDEILSGHTEIPDKYLTKIVDHKEVLERNKYLISMIRDVPIDLEADQIDIRFDAFFRPYSLIKEL